MPGQASWERRGPVAAGKTASTGPRAFRSATGTLRRVPDGQGRYELNAKIVVVVKVAPAFSSVDGKLGWLGEFGKCWVSNV